MFDEQGKKVWHETLDLWGKPHEQTEIRIIVGARITKKKPREVSNNPAYHQPFKFPGQYEDEETGLYYNRFRYYMPGEGIYTQRDPIGLAGGNPTVYGYVYNTLMQIDPWGLRCTGDWKKRRTLNQNDTGLKNHAQKHTNLSPKKYLARGQKNISEGILVKGGGHRSNANYFFRKIGNNEFSMTITNKKGQILSIDTWRYKGVLTQSEILKGFRNNGINPSIDFWNNF